LKVRPLDFRDVCGLFEGDTVTIPDDRFDYGETRYLTPGLLRHHVILRVHTDSEDRIRITSAQ
jgi:uncharacterized DUF497 family protein